MSQIPVLAVDNSEDDLTLLRLAFRKAAPRVALRTLDGGEEALRYINGEGLYHDREAHPIPKLILLDLKMPVVGGFDVLEAVQKRFPSRAPFVVMLSSSKLEKDISKAKALGATAFHTKPIEFHDFCTLVAEVTTFFCTQQDSGNGFAADATKPSAECSVVGSGSTLRDSRP